MRTVPIAFTTVGGPRVSTPWSALAAIVTSQLGVGPHLAATVAMGVVALLGGALVARNRLDTESTHAPQQSHDRDPPVTDRDHVCALVRNNGGRMKQSEIVNSVDWSKAKVSRLLADLEDDGRITKLRIGRENLICLPGNDPTASQPPDATNAE
ncbi:hypothetical protein OB905_02630 [Halobacteria archaeon AArc-dxtr1]|nr:hypothetical protein [Halobacteria archaeon AArc-dxtr1]